MSEEVTRTSTKLDRKQVEQLLKRGPEGFHQDITEFIGHLKTISESIDSLLKEYPLLIMGEANVHIKFNLGNDSVCKCILGFISHDEAKAKEQSTEQQAKEHA